MVAETGNANIVGPMRDDRYYSNVKSRVFKFS